MPEISAGLKAAEGEGFCPASTTPVNNSDVITKDFNRYFIPAIRS
jgi:hypothetical protein